MEIDLLISTNHLEMRVLLKKNRSLVIECICPCDHESSYHDRDSDEGRLFSKPFIICKECEGLYILDALYADWGGLLESEHLIFSQGNIKEYLLPVLYIEKVVPTNMIGFSAKSTFLLIETEIDEIGYSGGFSGELSEEKLASYGIRNGGFMVKNLLTIPCKSYNLRDPRDSYPSYATFECETSQIMCLCSNKNNYYVCTIGPIGPMT